MKGAQTRQAILERAVDLASVEGLEGLTIGRLADDLGMSKSGLFAHFGSKEELQLATIDTARQRYIDAIFIPALKERRGYPRLLAICRSWLDYLRDGVFPGGCFFEAASFEMDGRPGPVRDAIVRSMDEWVHALEKAIRMAQDEGHIDPSIDPAQLAFEINALFFGANFGSQLRAEPRALDFARRAIEARLESLRVRPKRQRRARSSPPRRRAHR